MSKLVPTCSKNQLRKQIVSNFLMFLVHTRTSGESFSDFWQKNSRKIVKNCFLQFQGVHLEEKEFFFRKKFLVWLPNFERSCFWLSAKILTEKLSKLFSTCSGNKVKKQTFHQLFGFYVYSDFKRNLFRLLEFSLCKFVKTAFYQVRRTLWSKKFLRKSPIHFLSGCDQNVFWL